MSQISSPSVYITKQFGGYLLGGLAAALNYDFKRNLYFGIKILNLKNFFLYAFHILRIKMGH